MTAPDRRPVYRVVELATFLGWSEDTIRREIKDGRLRARKLRGDTVIVETDLMAWLDSLPIVPTEATIEEETVPTPITVARPTRHQRVTRLVDIVR